MGGSRTLFVNSKAALFTGGLNSPNAAKSPSNMMNSGSFTNLDDPSQTLDYRLLKKNSDMSRTLAQRKSASHMDSAMSIQRLDREFSIDRRFNSSVKRDGSESPDLKEKTSNAKKGTELLIRDMTLDLEDHELREDELQLESLPGSCKSFYALQFRL